MIRNRIASWYTGRKAERMAVRHLKRRGLVIVETNVRIGPDEIDIVAIEDELIVFIEVKFRLESLEDAILALDGAKKRRLLRAARAYMNREGIRELDFRIDLVAISEREGKKEVVHLVQPF